MSDTDKLVAAAVDIQSKAYAPYSKFTVGAAILDESGQVHTGVNVENAAYPVGSCAEAGAISAMVAAGGHRIKAIAVSGGSGAMDEPLCTPCGGCRQRIREFAEPTTPIHICGPNGLRKTFTLGELLPESFGPENL